MPLLGAIHLFPSLHPGTTARATELGDRQVSLGRLGLDLASCGLNDLRAARPKQRVAGN